MLQVQTSQRKAEGNSKAGEEVRTPDIQLGKLTLYQLSYARIVRNTLYENLNHAAWVVNRFTSSAGR